MIFHVSRDGKSCGRFFGDNHQEAASKALTRICNVEGKPDLSSKKLVLECRKIVNGVREKNPTLFKVRSSPPTAEKPYSHYFFETEPKSEQSK
jgi:hypothetical protein